MNVFDLSAKIALDTKEYAKGLQSASSETDSTGKKLANTLGGVSKVAVAAFAAMVTAAAGLATEMGKIISDTAKYGDEIDKMSQKMGISAQAYQEWDFVLQHAGSSMESMKASMKTLANAAESNNEAFQRLGITQEQMANMTQEELFGAVISGLQNVEDTTERTYLAGQLLGRGATELGALLNMTADETEAMKNQLGELGGLMSDDAVKAAAGFQDSLLDLKTSFNGIKRQLGSNFVPFVSRAMQGITKVLAGSRKEGLAEVKGAINDIVDAINNGDALRRITDVFDSVIEIGIEVIKGFIKALPGLLSEIPSLVKDILMNIVNLIKEIDWISIISSIGEAILGVVGAIGESILRLIFPAADAWYAHKDAMAELYEEGEKIYEQAQRLGEQRMNTYSDLEAEAEILTDIKEKMLEYTDEQGHVKEGYEDEMEALIMLAEKQGVHIEMIDGEISNIDDLITSIDELIAKRKLDAVTAAETDLYEQAYKEKRKLEGEYKTHYQNFLDLLAKSDQAYAEGRTYEAQQYKFAAEEELAAAESLKDGIVEYTGQMELATYNMEQAAQGNLENLATNFSDAGIDVQNYYDDINTTNSKIIKNYEQTYGVDIPKAIEEGKYEQHKAITDMMDTAKAYGYDKALEMGWSVNDGFVKGLKDTKWKVIDEATHVMTSAINAAKKEARIESPSKVFAWMGDMMDQGLVLGVERSADDVINAVTDMHDNVNKAIEGIGGTVDIDTDINGGVLELKKDDTNSADETLLSQIAMRLDNFEEYMYEAISRALSDGFDLRWNDRELTRLVKEHA